MTQPSTTEVAQTEDLPTTNPRGIPVAHAMPWKGMPATLIGSTYLGEPDETGDVIDGGLLDGGTPYYWRSRNEKRERVFEAVVRVGEVIDVSRWNQGANYWPESTSLNADALPILDASGARNDVSSGAPDLPDPNDYDDPAKGKECAKALHDLGADVIFQIASKAGDGVFEAAQEGNFYAIGVDSDQKYIADDVIICSMKKEVGTSIYEAIKAYLNGDTSLWGTTWIADMSNGYVGIGYGEEGATQQVPDEVKAEVEALAAKIVSGEIKVDTTRG